MDKVHLSIAASDQGHIVATLKTEEEGLIGRCDLTETYGQYHERESVTLKAMEVTLHRPADLIIRSATEYSGEPTALITISS